MNSVDYTYNYPTVKILNMRDFIEYISWLASDGGKKEMFANCDEKHAIEVLVRIFENAEKEIKIFAGCLCGNVPDEIRYITALSDFIGRGGKLTIMLNNYDRDKAVSSNIFKRLAYYTREGKDVKVLLTKAVPYITEEGERKPVHFTVADDKAYRLEIDIVSMSAICDFNNPEVARRYSAFFDRVLAETKPQTLNLLDLFNEEA